MAVRRADDAGIQPPDVVHQCEGASAEIGQVPSFDAGFPDDGARAALPAEIPNVGYNVVLPYFAEIQPFDEAGSNSCSAAAAAPSLGDPATLDEMQPSAEAPKVGHDIQTFEGIPMNGSAFGGQVPLAAAVSVGPSPRTGKIHIRYCSARSQSPLPDQLFRKPLAQTASVRE